MNADYVQAYPNYLKPGYSMHMRQQCVATRPGKLHCNEFAGVKKNQAQHFLVTGKGKAGSLQVQRSPIWTSRRL